LIGVRLTFINELTRVNERNRDLSTVIREMTFVTAIRTANQRRISIMKRVHLLRLLSTQCWLCFFAVAIFWSHAGAQVPEVPPLGSRVPEQVMVTRTGAQLCLTDVNYYDPCASIKIRNVLFTIAWDADTKAISYLLTEDHHFRTDSELGVGGSCNVAPKVGKPFALFSYMDWLVTPKWADTLQGLSGDAVWYAALRKDATRPRYARIAGFVQSRYLRVGP
jgi:hypothetical protein